MSLESKFDADFSSFYAAVNQAKLSLSGFTQEGATAEQQMNEVADSLSGAAVIREATLMAAAIEKLGGVSGLTAKELEKVGAVGAEASEKLRAMGRDVPKGIDDMANAAKGANPIIGQLTAQFTGLAAVTFAGKLVSEAAELGQEVTRLSAATGLTTDEIQKLMAVANATSTPVNNLATAAQTLEQRIGAGNKGAVGAVKELGINFEEFKNLSPGEKLFEVSDALRAVGDDSEFAAEAAALFGGNWKTIAPALKTDMEQIAEGTTKLKGENAAAIDAMFNDWSTFWRNVVASTGNEIGALVRAFQFLGDETSRAFSTAKERADDFGKSLPPVIAPVNAAVQELGVSELELKQIIDQSNASLRESIAENKKMAEAQEELRSAGVDWRDTLEGMNRATVEAIAGYLEAGVSQRALATAYGATSTQIKAVAEMLKVEEKSIQVTTRLWEDYYELQTRQAGTATDTQIAHIERWARETAAKMQEIGGDTVEFYEGLAKLVEAKMQAVYVDMGAVRSNSMELYRRDLEQAAAKAEATYQYMLGRSGEFSGATIDHFGQAAQAARDAADRWIYSWEEASSSAVESVERAAEATTAAIERTKSAFDSLTGGGSKNAPGSVGVNTAGITFGPGGLEAAFQQFSARQGGGAMGGFVGGGPPPDFLSWALSMGLASRNTAPPIENTFNIVDTESNIARRVSEEIAKQVRSGTLVPA